MHDSMAFIVTTQGIPVLGRERCDTHVEIDPVCWSTTDSDTNLA